MTSVTLIPRTATVSLDALGGNEWARRQADLNRLPRPTVEVPCNGCTACCENDIIKLHPELGDDAATYQTQMLVHPLTGEHVLSLAHKPEGGCVYLGDNGCTIHGRAPVICREFDCRRFYLSLTRQERRSLVARDILDTKVLNAGKARLHTLDKAERKPRRKRYSGEIAEDYRHEQDLLKGAQG